MVVKRSFASTVKHGLQALLLWKPKLFISSVVHSLVTSESSSGIARFWLRWNQWYSLPIHNSPQKTLLSKLQKELKSTASGIHLHCLYTSGKILLISFCTQEEQTLCLLGTFVAFYIPCLHWIRELFFSCILICQTAEMKRIHGKEIPVSQGHSNNILGSFKYRRLRGCKILNKIVQHCSIHHQGPSDPINDGRSVGCQNGLSEGILTGVIKFSASEFFTHLLMSCLLVHELREVFDYAEISMALVKKLFLLFIMMSEKKLKPTEPRLPFHVKSTACESQWWWNKILFQ